MDYIIAIFVLSIAFKFLKKIFKFALMLAVGYFIAKFYLGF